VCAVVVLVVVVFFLVWTGVTLIIGSWSRCRRRPDLAELLRPFRPSIADEAEGWLRRLGD
jgi:hypothetical protein